MKPACKVAQRKRGFAVMPYISAARLTGDRPRTRATHCNTLQAGLVRHHTCTCGTRASRPAKEQNETLAECATQCCQ